MPLALCVGHGAVPKEPLPPSGLLPGGRGGSQLRGLARRQHENRTHGKSQQMRKHGFHHVIMPDRARRGIA